MKTDEQFGSELGARMRSELNDLHAASDLLPRVCRRLAWRTRMIRIAVVTPVVLVVTVALLIASVGQTQPRGTPPVAHGTSGPGPTSSGPPPVDTAYVLQQTEQSLSRATDYVIFLSTTDGLGTRIDMWLDIATHRYRNDVYENVTPVPTGTGPNQLVLPPTARSNSVPLTFSSAAQFDDHGNFKNLLSINYRQKTYSFAARLTGPPPQSGAVNVFDPNSLRNAVQSGRVQVLDEETVEGQDTLRLRIHDPPPASVAFSDFWVDSTTFLPLRQWEYKAGPDTPDEDVLRTTFAWLPRTPDDLAYLILTPPPGFRRT
jgi:hypothetical protein